MDRPIRALKMVTAVVALLEISCGQESAPAEESKGVPIGQVPVGEGSVRYANLDTPETQPIGPSGIFSVKGGYAVADNVGGSIVILDADFRVRHTVDVRGMTQGIVSVTQDGDDLVVLDGASATPKLLRIASKGTINSIEIRTAEANAPPTGLKRDDNGLVLDYGNGESLHRVIDNGASASLVPVEGYTWGGTVFSVDSTLDPNHHERLVHVGKNSAHIRVPNYLGAVQLVGPDGYGGTYVLVENVTMTVKISVEQSIWHLDANGQIVDVALVPMEERKVWVDHGITINSIGEPVVMVTKRDALQFWKVKQFSPSVMLGRKPVDLGGVLPSSSNNEIGVTRNALITYTGTCLTSSQMTSNVNEYLNVSQYLSATNINVDGSCSPRTKTTYYTGPGTWPSVSYDWGGWDTPSAFQSAMNSGGKAGNLDQTYASGLACSYGVDCSGFVTRVWGYTNIKRSTTTLTYSDTSYPVSGPGYITGDILDQIGSHVVIYVSPAANGLNIYEASGNPYGRVVARPVTWSYVSGFYSYRSNTSCGY